MERDLFDWSGWDGDLECMTFYDVVLKKQIGNFPPGTKFDSANLSWDTGVLQFFHRGEWKYQGGQKVAECILAGEFKLQLQLVTE